jgi:hypothetical protein
MGFIRDHFDKFLVSFFLLLTMAMVLAFECLAIKYPAQSQQLAEGFKFSTNAWLFFSGLFGGLISGLAIAKSKEQQKEPPPPPVVPGPKVTL